MIDRFKVYFFFIKNRQNFFMNNVTETKYFLLLYFQIFHNINKLTAKKS